MYYLSFLIKENLLLESFVFGALKFHCVMFYFNLLLGIVLSSILESSQLLPLHTTGLDPFPHPHVLSSPSLSSFLFFSSFFFLFFKYLLIYLAVPGLSCGIQNL